MWYSRWTSVLGEYTASFSKVKMSDVKMQFGYMVKRQAKWPLDRILSASSLKSHAPTLKLEVTFFFPENRYPPTREDDVVPVQKVKAYRRIVDIAPLILNIGLGGVHSVKMQKTTGHVLYRFSPKRTVLEFIRQEMIAHLYR